MPEANNVDPVETVEYRDHHGFEFINIRRVLMKVFEHEAED